MMVFRSVGAGGQNLPEDVQDVQKLINRSIALLGLPILSVDGAVGPLTQAAITAFQLAHGGVGDGMMRIAVSEEPVFPGPEPIELTQGQADGATIAEACKAAREDCQAQAGCQPGTLKMDKKCICWKGGAAGGYTCTVGCGCSAPIA
ncbi:peptidoglycan-binding domain-containing protein [Nocardia xishanensis]|uniref:peptidoglycan-binding domain-containing protein n=1 Tax=Nocardia xishanensis TaxID=238964 RepID=UPI00344A8371